MAFCRTSFVSQEDALRKGECGHPRRAPVDHVEPLGERGEQLRDLLRRMLQIVVHRDEDLAARRADSGQKGVVLTVVAHEMEPAYGGVAGAAGGGSRSMSRRCCRRPRGSPRTTGRLRADRSRGSRTGSESALL